MNTQEWVHYTVHNAVKEKLEKEEKRSERDKNAFAMLCEAIEEIESAVGIDKGGCSGTDPAVTAVKNMVIQRDKLHEALRGMIEDGGFVCGDWYPSGPACENAIEALKCCSYE